MGKKSSLARMKRRQDLFEDRIIDLIEPVVEVYYSEYPSTPIAISVLSYLTGESEKTLLLELKADPRILSERAAKVIEDQSDLYWKSRYTFTKPCIINQDCEVCDLSRSDWLGRKAVPSRICSKQQFVSFETFDSFLKRKFPQLVKD